MTSKIHICRALLLGALVTLTGCTWVKLSDAGAAVTLAETESVAACQHVGMVTTQTRHKVVMERGDASVHEELLVLARNQAAALGANVIVAMGPPSKGNQDFAAYSCAPDGAD